MSEFPFVKMVDKGTFLLKTLWVWGDPFPGRGALGGALQGGCLGAWGGASG